MEGSKLVAHFSFLIDSRSHSTSLFVLSRAHILQLASGGSTTDFKELTPEFFGLPEFLQVSVMHVVRACVLLALTLTVCFVVPGAQKEF